MVPLGASLAVCIAWGSTARVKQGWVFLFCFFVCLVFLQFFWLLPCQRWVIERGKVLSTGLFSITLPLWSVCSPALDARTTSSSCLCLENFPRNWLAPAIIGSKKVSYILMFFIMTKLRKTSQHWMVCGNYPSCLAL